MPHPIITLGVALFSITLIGCSERSAERNQSAVTSSSKPASDSTSEQNKKDVVTLTPDAVEKVREFQSQTGQRYLRVSMKQGGSTGFMYDMIMTDDVLDNDFVGDAGGIPTLVDKSSAIFIEGAVIDWKTTPEGNEGFHFDNPNAIEP